MDSTAMESSYEATVSRFNKATDRRIAQEGYGATEASLRITRDLFKELSLTLEEDLFKTTKSNLRPLALVMRNVSSEILSYCILNRLLHSVGRGYNLRTASLCVAQGVQGEAYAAGLLARDRVLAERIERAVKARHNSTQYRRQAARAAAQRAGYRSIDWSEDERLRAGSYLVGLCLSTFPDVFALVENARSIKYPQLTAEGLALAERAVDAAIRRNPVFVPCSEPPRPWTRFATGGFWDRRTVLSTTLVRANHKPDQAAIRGAMHAGTLAPHVDAVNSIQGVAWRINHSVLNVVKWAYEHAVPVNGVPSTGDVALPERMDDDVWAAADEEGRRHHKHTIGRIKKRNRGLVGERVLFAEDIATARALSEGAFYTPVNCDWRGRVYGIPHFNFQRDDRVRALFTFANGMPIGEDGLYWLKVHTANTYGADKVPFAERVAWVGQNIEQIKEVAWDPKSQQAVAWWSKADKPFLFLAACIEVAAALTTGAEGFVTKLPVSFDGSCSGLQHLCAMTRAPEGSLVNLTPSERPQDVYQTVADLVRDRIEQDAALTLGPQDIPTLARLCLEYGISRKLVKRNVMTYSYSSKAFGMSHQHMEDTMRPLAVAVLEGKLGAHPLASPLDTVTLKDGTERHMGDGYAASKYLAGHVYRAIESVVALPAQAMTFLQTLARVMAHENKALTWITPTGLPWANRYYEPSAHRVKLWLSDVSLNVSMSSHSQKIDKTPSANGVAPNFVHACDASHLALTVNVAVREGITNLALVHDSFGCLAAQAPRFRQIIREQFVQMYDRHDVLAEVLVQAQRDLSVHNRGRLPPLPATGPLNLSEVLNAEYAFA